MIVRQHYRASIASDFDYEEEVLTALEEDKEYVVEAIEDERVLTVALYKHEDMLFLYMESMDEELTPDELFPELSMCLNLWPERDGLTPWAKMYHIFYHATPDSVKKWERKGKKKRRGRIAYLYEDKIFSYTYWHKALVDEGLLEGDMYQSIALHEDILFSYFEEPKQFTHLNKFSNDESTVIKGWLEVDPESHFDHSLSGEENFLLLPEVFSMGKEDL